MQDEILKEFKGIKQQQRKLIQENQNTQKCCESLNKQIGNLNIKIADCKREIKELQQFKKTLKKHLRTA